MITNSAFVNVTYSAAMTCSPGNIFEVPAQILKEAAKGDWVMRDEETLNELKWLFPVRKNRVLGIFQIQSWQFVDSDPTKTRVRFELTIPADLNEAKKLKEEAQTEVTSSNFVVKYSK